MDWDCWVDWVGGVCLGGIATWPCVSHTLGDTSNDGDVRWAFNALNPTSGSCNGCPTHPRLPTPLSSL